MRADFGAVFEDARLVDGNGHSLGGLEEANRSQQITPFPGAVRRNEFDGQNGRWLTRAADGP